MIRNKSVTFTIATHHDWELIGRWFDNGVVQYCIKKDHDVEHVCDDVDEAHSMFYSYAGI